MPLAAIALLGAGVQVGKVMVGPYPKNQDPWSKGTFGGQIGDGHLAWNQIRAFDVRIVFVSHLNMSHSNKNSRKISP